MAARRSIAIGLAVRVPVRVSIAAQVLAGPIIAALLHEPTAMPIPACPQCAKENTYADGALWICADCGHEWSAQASAESTEEAGRIVRDANGNVLNDGDSVVLIKDLKLKGSSQTIKVGTKVRNIRLVDGDHEVDAKVEGMSIMLKACFLKKA